MFVGVGVVSILAGLFVFNQANMLLKLSMLTGSNYGMTGSFLFIAFAFIFSGAMMIASKSGSKRGFLTAATLPYVVVFLIAFTHYHFGDMSIWTFVSVGLVMWIIVWRIRHPLPLDSKLDKQPSPRPNSSNDNDL